MKLNGQIQIFVILLILTSIIILTYEGYQYWLNSREVNLSRQECANNNDCNEIVVVPANEQVVESFDFENGNGEQPESWITGAWKPLEAEFKWESSIGYSGSRSISITLNTANDAYWIYNTNLDSQELYRLTAYIKGENIVNREGGTMGAHLNTLTWENTNDMTGTFNWKKVSLIFYAPSSGITEIKSRLGSWYNTVTGKAWFDDIVLTSHPLTKYEGSHVYLMLEPNDLTVISDNNMKQWVANLDNVYNSYSDLVGTQPFNGQKVEILSVPQYPGGWAVAGNPIKWMQQYVRSQLATINNNGDWSFGILHEIGHNFDIDYRWVWDAEFFANFKMYYVVEALNGKVEQKGKYYRGGELKTFYKTDADNSYENTLKVGIYHNDGLTYKFIYIKDQIGWDPFKQTFRYFTALLQAPSTRSDKFNLFIDKLTEFSGVNVRNMFNEIEMNAILSELKKN